MATQATTLAVAVAVALVTTCMAVPHGNPAIGRQFLYPGIVPAPAPHFAAPVPAATYHVPHNNLLYYAPPAAANLVAPVPSALRYATVIAPQPARQQFIYYPPHVQQGILPGNVIVYGPRDENEEEGYYQSFVNLISNYIPSFAQQPSEEASEAEKPPETKPEKIEAAPEGASVPQTVDKTEKEPAKGGDATRKQDVPQRVVLYTEPQFYGNYASLQRVNPAAALPTADKGAVSSFLFLRNFPAPANYKAQPQSPEYNTQADSIRSESSNPISPVLGYQKFLVLPRQRGLDSFDAVQRDSSSSEESGSEESSADSNSSESGEAEKGEENSSDETGPTIAQVKPHAIALAGPGGVAAAAPVGTALVGPGGMALSAPSATAVAGASKGVQAVPVSPAAQKAVKTYTLASKNPSSLIKP